MLEALPVCGTFSEGVAFEGLCDDEVPVSERFERVLSDAQCEAVLLRAVMLAQVGQGAGDKLRGSGFAVVPSLMGVASAASLGGVASECVLVWLVMTACELDPKLRPILSLLFFLALLCFFFFL